MKTPITITLAIAFGFALATAGFYLNQDACYKIITDQGKMIFEDE